MFMKGIGNIMITVDILSPVGGNKGGIENVIRLWKEKLDKNVFRLRVIHMAPGMAYLKGFNDIYAFEEFSEIDINEKLTHFTRNYAGFIKNYGNPDICIAINWPCMCLVADAARKVMECDYKILSWVHSRIAEYEKAGLGGVNELVAADAHLCINSNNERQIKNHDALAVTYVIGNPVKEYPLVSNISDNTMCYVGRLQDVKCVEVILEALYRAHHKWKFKIVGSGESEEKLKDMAEFLGQIQSGQVEFLGWKEEPWNYCSDSVALIAASEYEGFMLTGAEALSMGMTVISTPVDGLLDYIVPGKNGYLFEQYNAEELAKILDYIYDGTLSLCDRNICRQSVEKYNVNNYFINVKKILLDCIGDELE